MSRTESTKKYISDVAPQGPEEKNEEKQLFFQISGKKRMITLICFVQWIVSMATAGNITHHNKVLLKRFHQTLGFEIIQKNATADGWKNLP